MPTFPDAVRIVEVGPCDGLQNEKQAIETATKIRLVEQLVDAGLTTVETGALVNPNQL